VFSVAKNAAGARRSDLEILGGGCGNPVGWHKIFSIFHPDCKLFLAGLAKRKTIVDVTRGLGSFKTYLRSHICDSRISSASANVVLSIVKIVLPRALPQRFDVMIRIALFHAYSSVGLVSLDEVFRGATVRNTSLVHIRQTIYVYMLYRKGFTV